MILELTFKCEWTSLVTAEGEVSEEIVFEWIWWQESNQIFGKGNLLKSDILVC